MSQRHKDAAARRIALLSIVDPGALSRWGQQAAGPTPQARSVRMRLAGRIGTATVAADRARRMGQPEQARAHLTRAQRARRALAAHDAAVKAAVAQSQEGVA